MQAIGKKNGQNKVDESNMQTIGVDHFHFVWLQEARA